MSEKLSVLKDFAWELFKIIIVSALIIIPIRYFVVQPFVVRGASMEPNFQNSEYLIIDELSYRFRKPERGEVIVFKFPQNTSQFFIKRIVGLPQETIAFRDGDIFISATSGGEEVKLDESSYLLKDVPLASLEVELRDNEYFVLGDNRNASSDSRKWGPLKEKFIVGKVLLRAWPFDQFDLFLEETVY